MANDDFGKLIAEFKATANALPAKVERATRKTVVDGAKIAAKNARVQYGHDRDSILASPFVVVLGDRIYGEWGSSQHYDIYQELGTHNPDGSQRIAPRFHHRTAYARVAPLWFAALRKLGGLG